MDSSIPFWSWFPGFLVVLSMDILIMWVGERWLKR